jgi:hypothetical protein
MTCFGGVLLNYNGKGDAVGEILTAFLLLGRDYKDLTPMNKAKVLLL